ncbi:carboxylesterase/lipase family protein [Mycolicibacterium smegmatis]|uniref:carboxylesterase/lipase family protein n=1 Tax=Mycolicibacterium smegmatis TaxID=1772 RepID=UPI001303240E|nr:carboxylesterase family protein [Mycolicibacterium smegmatis]
MRRARQVSALLFGLVIVLNAAVVGCRAAEAPVATDPVVVHTASGTVRGLVAEGHRLFAGIPYAAPPVGSLRFAAPEPAASWPGERDATRPGPRCVQDPDADLEHGDNSGEDCLTLNVWTPPVGKDLRPVMVWIHGGGFANGSSDVYDASRLASRGDIVVVTVNYRLGTLGFLAHPALGAPGEVGNYGIADQQAALRWVRDNIAAFGGDPQRVTLAGESAGGTSVCDHLVAPGSAGLFDAVILMSAPCQVQADLPTAEQRSVAYAAEAGCPDPASAGDCLRALPVDRLRKPVWYFNIGSDQMTTPVTGTAMLPRAPLRSLGEAPDVPVLIGTTRDEFTLFVALRYLRQDQRFTPEEYPELLRQTFGADADAVGAHYPLERYGGAAQAYSAAVTDSAFSCVAEQMADELPGTVYAYEFADRDAPAPEVMRTLPFPVGASHSLELRYLFDVGGAPPLNPRQQALADQMIGYWSQFVRTGDPAAEDQPEWPAYSASESSGRQWMSLRPDGSRMASDFGEEHQCPFWVGLKEK